MLPLFCLEVNWFNRYTPGRCGGCNFVYSYYWTDSLGNHCNVFVPDIYMIRSLIPDEIYEKSSLLLPT